jgi:hypothetical protein
MSQQNMFELLLNHSRQVADDALYFSAAINRTIDIRKE